jgi:hypothetical protein
MPLWALWRRNWAVWLMPVTGLIVATWNNMQLPYFDHYPYWMASQKTGALILLGMVTCLAGTAEGAWQRRSRLNEQPVARGFLARFGLPIVMTWLPTAALLAIGVAVVGGISAWQLWLTSLASLFAWTCLGMALGLMLPTVVALPVSVLAAFGWFAFTPAIEPPWPRHLSGTWDGCCTSSDVPNAGVMAGVVLVAAGLFLTAAGLVWVWARNRKPRSLWAAVMVVPVVAGLTVAGLITHDVGHSPTQPRTDPVICWPGKPEICMWPERRPYGEADAQAIRVITDHWRRLGVHIPERFSEAVSEPHAGIAPLVYMHSDSMEQRVEHLADSLGSPCDPDQDSPDGLMDITVESWLANNAGVPAITDTYIDLGTQKSLPNKPMAEQVRLINRALAAGVCR